MDSKGKAIFADYVGRLMECPRQLEAWRLRGVTTFLESGYPRTLKGVRDYVAALPVGRSHRTPAEVEGVLRDLIGAGKPERPGRRVEVSAPPLMGLDLPDALEEQLRGFVAWMQTEREYSPATVRSYAWSARSYLRLFPRVTKKDVITFRQQLTASGLSPGTVNLRLSGVAAFARYTGRPVEVKRLKRVRTLSCDNVPSEDEMRRLLEWLKGWNVRWYLVARCLSTTGLRVHELLKVTFADVMGGSVVLTGKGGKPRRVFFQRRFMDEVAAWLRCSPGSRRDERLCRATAGAVGMMLRGYSLRAGLDPGKFHPHAFRHYFAKQYLRRNPGDIVGLQALLGHSSIETTGIYLRQSLEEQLRGYHEMVTWD